MPYEVQNGVLGTSAPESHLPPGGTGSAVPGGTSGNVLDADFKVEHAANAQLHVTAGGNLMVGAQMVQLLPGPVLIETAIYNAARAAGINFSS